MVKIFYYLLKSLLFIKIKSLIDRRLKDDGFRFDYVEIEVYRILICEFVYVSKFCIKFVI